MDLGQQCSKTRRCIVIVGILIATLVLAGIIVVVFASLKPCFFIKCHSKASLCINRSPFKAQCICDASTAGNGRTVCDDCGVTLVPPTARIIGGSDAIGNSWPYAVLVRQRYKNIISLNGHTVLISSSWMCGGTLINHKTILTAAHCIKTFGDTFDYQTFTFPIIWNQFYANVESTLEVSVGLHDRRRQSERRIVKVRQVIRHPSFSYLNLLNDIAILKLEDYLLPSATIQFACLTKSVPDPNTMGTVVGFGDTTPGANLGSLLLQQVNLTLYPNDFCSNVATSTKKNWNLQLCCGDIRGRRDACQGDSGGGFYMSQNISNQQLYTLIGIVSYGEQCATPMKPGIYTRTSGYLDWIWQNSDF